MTTSQHDRATLDLTREEAWVLHTALLGYLEREAEQDRPARDALGLLRALEGDADAVLDGEDLRLVQTVLVEHLADAPLRDRATCRGVLDTVRATLA